MTFFSYRRHAGPLTLALCGLMAPAASSLACETAALVEAFSQTNATASAAPSQRPVQAQRLQEAELGQMPALARTESVLRQVGVPLSWHRMEASMLDAALDAGGGTLIVATANAQGSGHECEVLTPAGAGSKAARVADRTSQSPATLLALLPVREPQAAGELRTVQDALRGMLGDFRLAMRVGGQYAPQGAWVISPWVSTATVQREMSVEVPVPGLPMSLPGRAEIKLRVNHAGIGLTRGLTRETALSLLLVPQHSRSDATVSTAAFGPVPAMQLGSTQRQDDTLVGLGLYSLLVRQQGAVPNMILQGRGFGSSANIRAGGQAQLNALYDLGRGWAVAGTLGADAERPEGLAPSRFGRFATLGASAQLSPRWMVTLDAGQRELRNLPGSQSVQRLRVYRSFASMAYLAFVVDQEGQDRRATVTFARPF